MSFVQVAGDFSHVASHLHYNWTIRSVGEAFEGGSVLRSGACQQAFNKWFLELFPDGDREENRGYVTLYLRRGRDSGKKVAHASYEFIIKGTRADWHFSSDGTMTFKRGKGRGWQKLVKKNDLLCPSNGFIQGDTLKIQCLIDIREDNGSGVEVPESNLASDLECLIEHDRFSDVKIICGEKTFKCSKNILSARSPVFNAMFQLDMKESSTGEVVIEDIKSNIMEEVLNYIYTDSVKSFDGIAGELLAAADKYDLDRLKAMCEKNLAERVSDDSILETLMIAKQFSLEGLKNHVLLFLKDRDPSDIKIW